MYTNFQSGYPNKSKSKPYLLSTFNESCNYFLLSLGFFCVQLDNGPRVKDHKVTAYVCTIFSKVPYYTLWPFFLTLGLFLSATRKGWKESIGFRDAELYVKSFEKIHSLKKIKYSRSSPGDFICLFIYLLIYLFIYLYIF